jgi:SAM-dependent methyltransferase
MKERPSGAYYSDKLSAERLRRCYEVAPPRVERYLRAEIEFVARHIRPADRVLELGCGYGRALGPIVGRAQMVVGIDTSLDSLGMAIEATGGRRGPPARASLAAMDASRLALVDGAFDVVFCIQNGIAVFGVDRRAVFREAIRVTRPGGTVLFSSYAERFWPDRLEWFRIQSKHGLLGEIDEEATGNGVIVCTDGFRAETVVPEEFARLAAGAGVEAEISEVDHSSTFCVVSVP